MQATGTSFVIGGAAPCALGVLAFALVAPAVEHLADAARAALVGLLRSRLVTQWTSADRGARVSNF